MRIVFHAKVIGRLGGAVGIGVVLLGGPVGLAYASTPAPTVAGYNVTTQAIGAQFTFNVPGVVPLPNQNLIEEDVPYSRVNVGSGPLVDSLSAPYYPGDVAASLGTLLATFGAPVFLPNDPILAEAKYPTSPGYSAHASFGGAPPAGSPAAPSVFSAIANADGNGGDATGTISDLAFDTLGNAHSLPQMSLPSSAGSVVDVGNISVSNSVKIDPGSIVATAISQVKGLEIAGMVDITGMTSTASSSSDGTNATPSASLHLGQVTVNGATAYIDNTGVHIASNSSGSSGVSPAVLQQTLNSTLAQDGISIRLLDPTLTTSGAEGIANAGGLTISLAHQFDVPFIPGEPVIPVPGLGNVGLPAGLYSVTTSVTFGMAEVDVTASAVTPTDSGSTSNGANSADGDAAVLNSTLSGDSSDTGSNTFGDQTGIVQNLSATGPGSAWEQGGATSPPVASSIVDFPIHGVPAPLGWSVSALLGCLLLAYPMLLLARWQFVAGRRR